MNADERSQPLTPAWRAANAVSLYARCYLAALNVPQSSTADDARATYLRELTGAVRDLALSLGVEGVTQSPPEPPSKAKPEGVATALHRDAERVKALVCAGGGTVARMTAGAMWSWVGALT